MLSADEGEALAQFEQELLQMTDELGLEFAFMPLASVCSLYQ